MHKKDKNMWNKDVLGVYPKEAKNEDKYDVNGWNELWFLIPIFSLVDIFIVVFKIGSVEFQKRSRTRLKVNRMALFFLFVIIVIVVVALVQNI